MQASCGKFYAGLYGYLGEIFILQFYCHTNLHLVLCLIKYGAMKPFLPLRRNHIQLLSQQSNVNTTLGSELPQHSSVFPG